MYQKYMVWFHLIHSFLVNFWVLFQKILISIIFRKYSQVCSLDYLPRKKVFLKLSEHIASNVLYENTMLLCFPNTLFNICLIDSCRLAYVYIQIFFGGRIYTYLYGTNVSRIFFLYVHRGVLWVPK